MKKLLALSLILIVAAACNSDDEGMSGQDANLVLPTVAINPVTNILGDAASTEGDILNDGGSSISLKGISWSTAPNPDLGDTIKAASGGSNAFIIQITGLEFNTTYYVRAFATNIVGTAYSEELSFTTTNECTINLFEGDVTLRTQAEVDAFGANDYCGITGLFNLAEPISGGSDFIVDLTPLNNLRYVRRLSVYYTHELIDLSGLENLTVIDDNIGIIGNEILLTLEGLNNVTSPLGQIIIANNNVLQNIDGLSGLTTLDKPAESGSELTILGNPLLANIDGLINISSVDESIFISVGSSDVMTHVDGLSNISGTVQHLGVTGVDNLININGLSNITRINENLIVNNNYNLTVLTGLNQLEFIGGDLQFRNNFDLTNLDALSSLTTVGGNLEILDNELVDFCGLQPMLSMDGLGGNYLVNGNNYNPSEQDIIDGNCAL